MTRPTLQQLNEAVAAETARCAALCDEYNLQWVGNLIRESAAARAGCKSARLAQVTDEAIQMFNSSRLVKQNGGLLAAVHPTVGRTNRQSQVKRCIKVARDICRVSFESEIITPEFWEQYFAICHGDDFLAARGPKSPGHEGWTSNFEYLTRPATMLKVFEKSEAT